MSAKRFGAVYFDDTTKASFQGLLNGSVAYDISTVINFCNQSNQVAKVSLAYMVDPIAVQPAQADYLMFYFELVPYQVYQYPVLAVESAARIVVYSDIAGVSVVAHGYQDEV